MKHILFIGAIMAMAGYACSGQYGKDNAGDGQPDEAEVLDASDTADDPADLFDGADQPVDVPDVYETEEADHGADPEDDFVEALDDPEVEDVQEEETGPVCEIPDGPPYFVRVSRVTVSSGGREVIDEYEDTPNSLRPFGLERTFGYCVDWMPGSAVVTPVTEDPDCGYFEYEVTGLGYDHGNDDEKACIIILKGDFERCEAVADEYGCGIWVTKWNIRWAETWCAEHACDRDWEKTMKIEAWHDTNENCTWEFSENLERYTDDIFEWDADETYRIIIEYN